MSARCIPIVKAVNGPGYIAVGYQLTVANRFTDWFG